MAVKWSGLSFWPALSTIRAAVSCVIGAAMVVATATSASAQATSGNTPPQQAPEGYILVEEDVIVPLLEEPEVHFEQALKEFKAGKKQKAANQIRIAAALIRLEAGRHDSPNQDALKKAAAQLDTVANEVEKGSLTSAKKLHQAFAKADLALAKHFQQLAQNDMKQSGTKEGLGSRTAQALHASATYLEHGAAWAGRKLDSAGRAVVSGAKSLVQKTAAGVKAAPDAVEKGIRDLGSSIDSLGNAL